jgi:large subunit ribosomal protein L13
MATRVPRKGELEEHWLLVDAEGKTLGRLASFVATRLRGKHRPTYTPHLDAGDHVIVVNAARLRLTGQKGGKKVYYSHSGQPGGLKEVAFTTMMERHPDRVIRLAVGGMLPKNTLGRRLLRKLKVYPGPDHPHQAQAPVAVQPAARG